MQDGARLDWPQLRRTLRQSLATRAGGDAHLVDDLVQEASVRLLRASRREELQDPTGMAITIAQRTWTDHLRRITRHRKRFAALEEGSEQRIPDPSSLREPQLGDPSERIAFVVQQLLRREGAQECLELARSFLSEQSWQEVAERLQIGYAAVRKRWSRCLATLREKIAGDAEWSALLGVE